MAESPLFYDAPPQLFERGRIGRIDRDPLRPLGGFSDFVVEALPRRSDALLKAGPGAAMPGLRALAVELEAALAAVAGIGLGSLSDEAGAAARTDAVYAYNALIRLAEISGADAREVHAAVVPAPLHRLVEETSRLAAAPPFLTYGDMILANPLQRDPRIFTHGATGLAERDFCNGHRYIEFLLDQAIDALEGGLGGTAEKLKEGLEATAPPLDETCQVMRIFRDRMPRARFVRFRQFFGMNPVHGRLGPSGRFSARVAHLTILMVGDVIHQEQPQFYRSLFELRELFPAAGFARLFGRIDRSFCPDVYPTRESAAGTPPDHEIRTVRQAVAAHGRNKSLLKAFDRCKRLIDSFTNVHIAAARKFTIDADLPAFGTRDGEAAEVILRQRYRIGGKGITG